MTVVSAMKFNDSEGAIVADEQSSNQIRKSDIAEKIHQIKKDDCTILYGGSGAADFLYEADKRIEAEVANPENKWGGKLPFLYLMSGIMDSIKQDILEKYIQSNYQVSIADLQSGFRMVDGDRIELIDRQKIWEAAKTQLADYTNNNSFLALAKDSMGLELFDINSTVGRPIPSAQPYSCIGSGTDMAEASLFGFFENIPRNHRKNIDYLAGIAALLHATDVASRRNIGVGGTPLIHILKNNTVITPPEDNSRLASEYVRAQKKGFIKEAFMYKAIDDLLFKDANFQEMDDKMRSAARNPKKLDLMLRGYKIE